MILKSIVFTVCEQEYMNMCPPPPIIDLPAPLDITILLQRCVVNLVTLLCIKAVSDLLEQPCQQV